MVSDERGEGDVTCKQTLNGRTILGYVLVVINCVAHLH